MRWGAGEEGDATSGGAGGSEGGDAPGGPAAGAAALVAEVCGGPARHLGGRLRNVRRALPPPPPHWLPTGRAAAPRPTRSTRCEGCCQLLSCSLSHPACPPAIRQHACLRLDSALHATPSSSQHPARQVAEALRLAFNGTASLPTSDDDPLSGLGLPPGARRVPGGGAGAGPARQQQPRGGNGGIPPQCEKYKVHVHMQKNKVGLWAVLVCACLWASAALRRASREGRAGSNRSLRCMLAAAVGAACRWGTPRSHSPANGADHSLRTTRCSQVGRAAPTLSYWCFSPGLSMQQITEMKVGGLEVIGDCCCCSANRSRR